MFSNRIIIIVLTVFAIIIGLVIIFWNRIPENPSENKNTVVAIEMTDTAYSPSRVTIKKGETITFVNEGSNDHWPASNIHPTHGIYPEFDSLRHIGPGGEWQFTFDKAGTWYFHDHLYPGMTGVIIVE